MMPPENTRENAVEFPQQTLPADPPSINENPSFNGDEKKGRERRYIREHTTKIDIRSLDRLRAYMDKSAGTPWNQEEIIYQLWYLTEFAHTMITALRRQQRAIDELRLHGDPNDREEQFLERALLTHPGEPINHPPDWPPED